MKQCSGLGTGTAQRDGMGREEEGVPDGEHVYTHGWLMSVYAKNQHNIAKFISYLNVKAEFVKPEAEKCLNCSWIINFCYIMWAGVLSTHN